MLASAVSSFTDQRVRAAPVAQTFAVFRKRVDAYDATIELPSTPQAIESRILPETPAESGRYRVSLSRLREDSSLEPATSVSVCGRRRTVSSPCSRMLRGCRQGAIAWSCRVKAP